MTLTSETDDDPIAIIGDYLERCGVTDLRRPHDVDSFNKSAIIRYLVAEKLQEALANPPTPAGRISRHGAGGKRSKSHIANIPSTKPRK